MKMLHSPFTDAIEIRSGDQAEKNQTDELERN